MAGVLLFNIPQAVQVIMPNNPAGGVMITSFHHTRSDFKVFWNIDNVIDFFVRDYDRKIKSVGNETYVIIITHPKTGKLLSQNVLSIVDAAAGHLQLTILAADTLALPIGNLRYSITVNSGGLTKLLYTDRDHGPQSTLEVKYGPLPAIIDPTYIHLSDFAMIDGGLRAGSYVGPSNLSDGSDMRTFLISTTNFSGQIAFEAAVTENVPSTLSDWFVAHTENFVSLTGTRTANIQGNYSWIRLVLTQTSGTLDEIILR